MLILTLPFFAQMILAGGVTIGILVFVGRRKRPRWPAVVGLSLAGALTLFEVTPIPRVLWDLDFYFNYQAHHSDLVQLDLALSRSQRSEVARLAAEDGLTPRVDRPKGTYWLPDGYRGLSVGGDVSVWSTACGASVFFMTVTGFSPDPYAGFEYSPGGCPPEVDPQGSGSGVATDLGGGWYWIEAS
jgi:hypothetical protein